MSTIRDVTKWIRAEYLQTPALQLRALQLQDLCGIGQAMPLLALDSLVASKFLRVTVDGVYARVTPGNSSPSAFGVDLISHLAAYGPPGEPGTLVFRQPERRRHRSDGRARAERAQWVRQWN